MKKRQGPKQTTELRVTPVAQAAKSLIDPAAFDEKAGGTSRAQVVVSGNGNHIEFKMTVECANDGDLLYEMLKPYVVYWEAKNLPIRHKGKEYPGVAVEIEFGLREGALTLAEIRSIFRHVVDCHVAEETVALARDYTGVRVPLEETDTLLQAPTSQALKPMIHSLNRTREFVQVQLRRVERTTAMLREICDTGALPQLNTVGHIAVVTHEPTGLVSFRRISGMATADQDPVGDRMLLLQS